MLAASGVGTRAMLMMIELRMLVGILSAAVFIVWIFFSVRTAHGCFSRQSLACTRVMRPCARGAF